MTRFKFLLFIPVLAGFAALAYAGFDEAKEAYEKGDYSTAYKEFKALAEQGNAQSQFYLGAMCDLGQGVPQNKAEAMKWYRKAAEQGYAMAQCNLGLMYAKGNGAPQDYAEAVKWFRRAAEEGYVKAQYNLGVAYEKGDGVEKDFVLAHMWFNLAAVQGDSDAKKQGDLVARQMTPAQIAEAQSLARVWKPKGRD